MFNYLIDRYPETVEVDGKEYPVVTDFKTIVRIQEILKNELFTQIEKTAIVMKMFYREEAPSDREKAYNEYENFIKCFQPEERDTEDTTNGEIPLDFSIDSQRIFSAFYFQYGIDLNESDMHWFKFIALLNGLCDGTPQLLRVIDYRTRKITNDMGKEEASFFRKMRDKYSIVDPQQKQEERRKTAKEIEEQFLKNFAASTKGE